MVVTHTIRQCSNVANLLLKVFEFLLEIRVLLVELLVLSFPLIPFVLESLNLALEVSSLYVSDSQPANPIC
jgi:hypothetical protein